MLERRARLYGSHVGDPVVCRAAHHYAVDSALRVRRVVVPCVLMRLTGGSGRTGGWGRLWTREVAPAYLSSEIGRAGQIADDGGVGGFGDEQPWIRDD